MSASAERTSVRISASSASARCDLLAWRRASALCSLRSRRAASSPFTDTTVREWPRMSCMSREIRSRSWATASAATSSCARCSLRLRSADRRKPYMARLASTADQRQAVLGLPAGHHARQGQQRDQRHDDDGHDRPGRARTSSPWLATSTSPTSPCCPAASVISATHATCAATTRALSAGVGMSSGPVPPPRRTARQPCQPATRARASRRRCRPAPRRQRLGRGRSADPDESPRRTWRSPRPA